MKESQYSIKDLENLTNIKAHTIRIWEQRYGLLHPKRTDTNIRYYSDNDLKKLLNVNLLYTNGLKISKIAKLSDDEIVKQAKEVLESKSKTNSSDIDAMLIAIIELDSQKTTDILEQYHSTLSIREMYSDFIIPLLEKIGELWQFNTISVGHEHFFSNILREFLLSKTYELTNQTEKDKKVLFFLHADEQHELSLLIYHYMFKQAGWNVCYLGQNVPNEDLKITCDQFKPDLAVTSFIKHINESDFKAIISELSKIIPENKLLIGGKTAINFKKYISPKISLIEGFENLESYFV